MKCMSKSLFFDLLQENLSQKERLDIERHIQECHACQTLYAELKNTWDTLGTWDVIPPQSKTIQNVMSAVSVTKWPMILKTAALLALALSLGVIAGILVSHTQQDSEQLAERQVDRTELLDSMGLVEWSVISATGLLETQNETPVEKKRAF